MEHQQDGERSPKHAPTVPAPECGHQDAKKEAREIYTLGQRLVLVQISQNFGKPGVDDNDHTTGLGGRSKRPRMWDKT